MRLLVVCLVVVVLRNKDVVSAQCSPQCSCNSPDGTWSPLYRMLTAPPPSDNDIVPRGPARCSCGCSPRRLPPRLPSPPPINTQQIHGISALSGVVVDSPVFQQVGPATVIQTPPAMYVPSLDVQDNSLHTCDTSSHIMTIPRKQESSATFTSFENPSNTITSFDDTPPTVSYSTAPNARPAEIFSSTSDESPITTYDSMTPDQVSCQHPSSTSVMPASHHNVPPHPPAPRPIYFPQPAPLYASCPATLFYPAAPAMTCSQPSFIYPGTPSYPSPPVAGPTISQSFNAGTCSCSAYSTNDNIPASTYSMTPSQDIPCNAPQTAPSSFQTFPTSNHQSTPSNTVNFSTYDNQQTPTNSVNCNTNFQQTPSSTVFFGDSDSTGGAGTHTPESTGPTVTTHDSPLTYTLLTSSTNNGATKNDNRDCSVPVPPVLV